MRDALDAVQFSIKRLIPIDIPQFAGELFWTSGQLNWNSTIPFVDLHNSGLKGWIVVAFRWIPAAAIIGLLLVLPKLSADEVIISRNTLLVQDVPGDLIVRNGATLNAQRIRIGGNVTIEAGASFFGQGVQVDGSITAEYARNVTLKKYGEQFSVIGGDVSVAFGTGAIRVFDSQLRGHLLIEDNLALDIVVRNSSIDGDIQLFANQVERYFVLRNNTVLGNIQLAGNQPEPQSVGNAIAGPAATGSLIELRVAGDEADETFQLQIDQRSVRQWTATGSFRQWRYRAAEILTADRLRVAFTNDVVSGNGYDRNLHVDSIAIDGVLYQTEDPSVYSKGAVIAGQLAAPGFQLTETLGANGYFQFGLTGIEEQLMLFALNQALPSGWTFGLINDGTDIRLRTFDPAGRAAFQMRFGAGGALSNVQDSQSGKQLLARAYRRELTDRVIQWTIWEQGQRVVFDVPSLPYWEDRFNMAQAGTYNNVLHGTVAANISADRDQLDVWSVADRLWKAELEPYMSGSIAGLTRTYVLGGGALLVRRVIRVGEIRLRGAEVTLENPLFECWNPFSDTSFDAIALSIDNQGRPDRWYVDSKNIPNYPAWPVAETRGWGMVYNRFNISGGNTMAVVYGQDSGRVHLADGTTTGPRRFVLNTIDFSGGLGILPGFWAAGLPKGSIIDQYYILVPARGIKATTAAMLDTLSDRLPVPQVYHPGAVLSGELSVIADRLAGLATEPRVATDQLGTLN